MNNLEELICQSRIKEISHGSSPLIGEKERLALTAMYWHQEHQAAVEAFQETGRNLLLAQEQITALIAQLEAAQKERDDLLNQEFQQRLANAEHQLYMKDLAIHNIKASRKAQFRKRLAAEAALSAANERLSKPVYQYRIRNLYNGQASGWQTIAPDQVNTVLRMNPENAEFQILAAGFTVEGNADAE
ncbi:hypothetical protein [Yersinia frederiksenii]|uniref:hypothetical protein n=1 Tax=Yersinia frederiksenii TaxID=29484 RepID=UPI000BFC5CDD|nr:hypothetical protein [Yersinia frederiksenii]ATM84970.1 hypothetical protein CRN74_02065 [Yersinia frederiksenii]